MKQDYITGTIKTIFGPVPLVSTVWSRSDIWQTIKVRWNLGRMNYKVEPGLYAAGNPDATSDVFVSANFKLSFDHLRRALHGINAWILVLDTKGINVWCAAGKGTFGTAELINRIKIHALLNIVDHRNIIVPQLGAVGVSAHEVKSKTGFRVIYGPVRADDIRSFIETGYKATPEMRRVNFPLKDRIKLIPVEITYGKYYLLFIPALFFILAGFSAKGYTVDAAWHHGGRAVINLFSAYLAGCVLTPLFLPWIPFKRFSLKGLAVGWLITVLLLFLNLPGNNIIEIISWFLIIGAISSFMAMNFTGSSTFTSLSGVQKEMKLALPLQIAAAALGLIGWIVTRFI
ncbi:MAG TPA: mercury methylation corrinoid protein HgcA [Bacteroidales bacterium]|nr:mercury methylation corrinoid protein HgcA [Bacteroidales bacterium]